MDDERIYNFGCGGYNCSGYLEDVLNLLHYANSTKRRKLLLYTPHHQDSSTHIITNNNGSTYGCWESSRSRKSVDQECMIFPTPPEPLEEGEDAFSSSILKSPPNSYSLFSIPPNCQENNIMKKKMMRLRSTKRRRSLVYPFGLVKPGGEEGDVTLKDINQRLLMPPTRPIPHPVAHFASVSNKKPPPPPHGLSGKPVVALTTIPTLGTGTITIITTKP